MVTVRSVAQWGLGVLVALFALTALSAIERSPLSILQGVLAALLFLGAAALIVPRTRAAIVGRSDRSVSSGVLAVLVVVAVLTGVLVTPLDADDEPAVDADAEDLEAADTDGQADDEGAEGDDADEQDAEAESDDGTTDETDSESGPAESDGGDDGTERADADDGSSDESEPASTDGDPETEPTTPVDGELEIHHIDVGQADATLLVTPDGETVLIDTGDWRQDGSAVIASLESQGIDRIDHLVATHAHADHIGGHAAVIEHFETDGDGVGAAYDSGVAHDSATYENYLDAVETHDVDLFEVEEGDELPIDGLEATVLNPPAGASGDLHYNSVAVAFEFGEFAYLTTGDAEADAERRMIEAHGDDLEADAYQAGHHGSSTSSTQPFVDAVDPEIAVISSGYDSQYGHPHEEVLEEYAERGIETYWTGVHGDVVVTTDGTDVSVETEREFSTDAADLRAERPDEQARVATPQIDTATAGVSG